MARTKRNAMNIAEAREKIRTTQLVNRLENHAFGRAKMSATQVTAALGLLKKALPDLASVELSGEIQKTYVVRAPAPVADMAEWQDRYAPKPTIQ
jgi:hypothetical protein